MFARANHGVWRGGFTAGLVLTACYSGGEPLEGFGRTEPGTGPQIVWDLHAKPLPEVPFPNDLATRSDLTSPTGRRVNASQEADTAFERRLRGHMQKLDGFGTFAPAWLRFDAPLDLVTLAARQQGDAEFEDDAVFLIDVTPNSPTYGEAQVLDFGHGSFPVTAEPGDYFTNDPRPASSNLLFETYEEDVDDDDRLDQWEDLNQNGVLDEGEDQDGDGRLDIEEDTDGDGVFDHPNLWGTVTDDLSALPRHPQHPDCPHHPYFDLLTFFELETNTLQFRPLVPLRERTTYAVVITKRVTDESGAPVRSPFEYVHHLAQLEAVAPLFEDGLLEEYHLAADDVAFTWTFTTQSVYETLVTLREGLHGLGPFARLAEEYPDEVTQLVPVSSSEGFAAYRLTPESLVSALNLVFENVSIPGFDSARVGPLLDTYGSVDYLVAGDYVSPDFLKPTASDERGVDGVFDVDPRAGRAVHEPASLRFLMVVPKPAYGAAPFPVLLYCHGYSSLKLEALAFAGVFAKFGIATFVIDSYSHGLPFGGEAGELIRLIVEELAGAELLPFFDAVSVDRGRDLNGDGINDIGGDFWTNDTFHTRDIVRQTVVDYLQAVRVLQSFDGERRFAFDLPGLDTPPLAGDFNGDGQVDVGGPDNVYYVAGTSMGGILSSIIGAIEPKITTAAPISPGGGLLEVGLRTDLGRVTRAVIMPVLGPMIITEPLEGDPALTNVQWLVNDVFDSATRPIARVGTREGDVVSDEARPGDILRVENLTNLVVDEVVLPADRRARAHIPADVNDAIAISVWRPDGTGEPMFPESRVRSGATLVKRIETYETEFTIGGRAVAVGEPITSIAQGLGFRRNSPSLRRMLGISQAILEPADPANWAPRYADPLDIQPEGRVPTKILYSVTMGDMTVPVSTGIAVARAAGIIGYREPDPVYGVTQNQLLIDTHVAEGIDELFYFTHDCCHAHCGQVNFDIDDLSDGAHTADLPRLAEVVEPLSCSPPDLYCFNVDCTPMPPLRATVRNADGFNAVRFPALNPRGQHAVDIPDPNQVFDASMFTINQVGLFLSSGGRVLSDHPCLARNDCRTCEGEADCPSIPAPTVSPVAGP